MYQDKRIGVVVPAYDEEEHIESAINSVPALADVIYVVDDGSTDETGKIARRLAGSISRITVISHTKNRGVGAAIATGLRKCLEEGVDIAAVMAGDNQMAPEYLKDLLTPIVDGRADYAKGERVSRPEQMKGMSNWRRLGNWSLKWLTRIASGDYGLLDPQGGYTAISYDTLKRLNLDSIYASYGYCNDILVKLIVLGARVVEVPTPYRNSRGSVTSKIRYSRYIPKVSWLLLRLFFWRLKVKYLKGDRP